ncbi:MAG: glycosyltransferase [Terriglobia bacterium]
MRIAHIDTGKDLRGGQGQLLTLARELRERDYDQVIVCSRGSELERRACAEGFQTLGLRFKGPASLRALLRLRSLVRRQHICVLHAHDGRGQTLAWLSSCGLRVCRVASRRVAFLPRGRFIHRLKYAHTCHGVIAVSAYVRNLLVESGIPASQVAVIPDGIDFPEKLPDLCEKAQLRRKWQLDREDFVVGHAGAFAPEKGQAVAIEAVYMLGLPHLRLLLAGEGPTRKRLEENYLLKGAAGSVRFLGYLEDHSAFMDALDLFLMPSSSEGLGSAVLMAMSHGVPVIATRVGGLPEIVEEGVDGWLVNASSPRALAEALRAAESNRIRLKHMGERARSKARQFTGAIMAERTVELYTELVERFGLR